MVDRLGADIGCLFTWLIWMVVIFGLAALTLGCLIAAGVL